MTLHIWEVFHCEKMNGVILLWTPHSLLPDFELLCPHYVREDAKVAAHKVGIPDLTQATFYAMTVAYAEGLGVLPTVVGEVIGEALGNL